MKSQINLADYIKISHPSDGREGYVKKPQEGEYDYWEQPKKMVDLYGKPLPYRFLPHYEGKFATPQEVIYLGAGEDGWPALIEAYYQFEKTGQPFTYHTFIPCSGTTVTVVRREGKVMVNDRKVGHPIIALGHAFERFDEPLPDIVSNLEEKYFLEAYKKEQMEYGNLHSPGYLGKWDTYMHDNYFHLLSRGGMINAIKVAHNNEHTNIAEILQSWVDCGMTDKESRRVWLHSTKDSCYNHDYFWNGVVVCSESYGLEAPRTKTLHTVTSEKIQKVRDQEEAEKQARKEARKAKFEEAFSKASKNYGQEVINLALHQKGSVIATLLALAETVVSDDEAQKAIKAAKRSQEGFRGVLVNLLAIIAENPRAKKVKKIAQKAYAWAYLENAFPEITFTGYFDEAREALELYAEGDFDQEGNRLVYSC